MAKKKEEELQETETALKEDKSDAEVKKNQPEEIVEVKPENTVKAEESIVAPVNTTASIATTKTNAQLSKEIAEAKKRLEGEKLVKVSIPAVLQGQLGAVQYVAVNGVHVNVPVDGEEHAIPESLAKALKDMLKNLK